MGPSSDHEAAPSPVHPATSRHIFEQEIDNSTAHETGVEHESDLMTPATSTASPPDVPTSSTAAAASQPTPTSNNVPVGALDLKEPFTPI